MSDNELFNEFLGRVIVLKTSAAQPCHPVIRRTQLIELSQAIHDRYNRGGLNQDEMVTLGCELNHQIQSCRRQIRN